ncbi:lipopolysaccharide biosynthesis protein [Lysinibacillus sphaericus]
MPKVKNQFLSNVVTILGGTTSAQIIPIIASPLLTRIFSPADFGDYGLFIAIIGVFSVISSLKYDQAINLPKSNKNAINVLVLSLSITVILSLVVLILAIIFYSPLSKFIFNKNILQILWLLPLSIFISGIYQVLLNWSIRNEGFSTIAKSQLYKASTTVLGQVGGGLIISVSFILMFFQLLGQVAGSLKIFFHQKNNLKKNLKYVSKKNIIKQLIRYKNFPLFYSSSALLNTLSVQLPLFILAIFFSSTTVGYYTLAHRILASPISIIGTAVAQPFLQKGVENFRNNKLGEFSLAIFRLLLSLGLTPMIILALIAPELFSYIFGEEWVKAGLYVQLIAGWLLFVFISSPLSHIFTIMELQKENLYFNLIIFISRIFVLMIGGLLGNDILTIALFGLTGVIIWFIQILWLLNKTGIKKLIILRSIFNEIVYASPFIICALIAKSFAATVFLLFAFILIIFIVFSLLKIKEIKRLSI